MYNIKRQFLDNIENHFPSNHVKMYQWIETCGYYFDLGVYYFVHSNQSVLGHSVKSCVGVKLMGM